MMRNKAVDKLMKEQATNFGIAVVELKEIISGLRADLKRKDEMIEKLWERLMARDLPELATYGRQPDVETDLAAYNPYLDEDNAGEILDAIESNKANG